MPTRAEKLCSRHGPFSGRRCPRCQTVRLDQWAARAPVVKRGPTPYDTPVWREASRVFLMAHPHCQASRHPPFTQPQATVVDHIDGLGPDGPHGMDPGNWQALCRSCHSIKGLQHDGLLGNPRTPPDDPRRRQ